MLALALLAVAAPVADLSWLSGYWLSCEGGREVSETWSSQQREVVLGMAMSVNDEKLSWEQTRIVAGEGTATFFANPSGQSSSQFKSIELGPQRVVFENPTHDFPQRVTYSRKGDTLTGRIDGVIQGATKSMEWRYAKAPLNTHCSKR